MDRNYPLLRLLITPELPLRDQYRAYVFLESRVFCIEQLEEMFPAGRLQCDGLLPVEYTVVFSLIGKRIKSSNTIHRVKWVKCLTLDLRAEYCSYHVVSFENQACIDKCKKKLVALTIFFLFFFLRSKRDLLLITHFKYNWR